MRLKRNAPFDACYTPEPNTGCWLWMGAVNHCGYGHVFANARNHFQSLAHRVSWLLFRGAIPDSLRVLHACDVPCCVNPQHLFLGTPQLNSDDMVAKQRAARGERVGTAVLSAADIPRVRQLYASGETLEKIAKEFGLHGTTVAQIVYRATWRHIV